MLGYRSAFYLTTAVGVLAGVVIAFQTGDALVKKTQLDRIAPLSPQAVVTELTKSTGLLTSITGTVVSVDGPDHVILVDALSPYADGTERLALLYDANMLATGLSPQSGKPLSIAVGELPNGTRIMAHLSRETGGLRAVKIFIQ